VPHVAIAPAMHATLSAPMYGTDPPRRHSGLLALFLVLAVVLTLGAVVAIWLDRQALSNSGWSDTSVNVLENPQVRTAVSAELVTQLFQRARVDERLQDTAGPLAPAAEHELRKLAQKFAFRALTTGQIQDAWRVANSQAHRQLVADIEHNRGQDVYLRLGPILNELLRSLRTSKPVSSLPGPVQDVLDIHISGAGRIRVLRADQVDKVRVAINTIRNLVLVLSLLAGICFVMAILVATGRHLRAVAYVGACLAICGGILLGARALIGPALADALVPASEPVNRAAVRATWMVGSSQLRTAAIIAFIAGGVLLFGGAIAAILARRSGRGRAEEWPWAPG
jgi:hypothetical protein